MNWIRHHMSRKRRAKLREEAVNHYFMYKFFGVGRTKKVKVYQKDTEKISLKKLDSILADKNLLMY